MSPRSNEFEVSIPEDNVFFIEVNTEPSVPRPIPTFKTAPGRLVLTAAGFRRR